MTTDAADKRFVDDAAQYAAYLTTPEGRLRLDLAFANAQEFFPPAARGSRALDVGGGTGALSVRLAQLGFHVTLLDPSSPMLEIAERAAHDAGVTERIELQLGNATQMAGLFEPESFDVILFHNVIEFVVDPGAALDRAARFLRSQSGILSILVRNRPGEVLKAALVNGNLSAAEQSLRSDWGEESLYGGKVRLFTAKTLRALVEDTSFAVVAERGVRVFSDYLPPKISRTDAYEEIFELERKLGGQPEFAAVARYTQCVARRTGPLIQKGA